MDRSHGFTTEQDNDSDQPGTLAFYATLLEDSTTLVSMNTWARNPNGNFMWDLIVATPENPMASKAWGNWGAA